jgi:hypothetical protein
MNELEIDRIATLEIYPPPPSDKNDTIYLAEMPSDFRKNRTIDEKASLGQL